MKRIQTFFDITSGGTKLPSISKLVLSLITGYDHEKYWRRRAIVVDPHSKVPLFIRLYYLYYVTIKK